MKQTLASELRHIEIGRFTYARLYTLSAWETTSVTDLDVGNGLRV